MKIFLDANILVSVVNKEYPLFTYSARIVSLANHPNYEVYTSGLCLAISFYFAEKKNKKTALNKITLLSEYLSIASIDETSVIKTTKNKEIHDFEDGLEYYSATGSNCVCIITEDVDDFYFSEIEVLNAKSFCEKYLMKITQSK
jgi:predicted nucleic acid-binding protein